MTSALGWLALVQVVICATCMAAGNEESVGNGPSISDLPAETMAELFLHLEEKDKYHFGIRSKKMKPFMPLQTQIEVKQLFKQDPRRLFDVAIPRLLQTDLPAHYRNLVIAQFTAPRKKGPVKFPTLAEFIANRPETVDIMAKNMYFTGTEMMGSEGTVPRNLADLKDPGITRFMHGMYMDLIIFDLVSVLRGLEPKISQYFKDISLEIPEFEEVLEEMTGKEYANFRRHPTAELFRKSASNPAFQAMVAQLTYYR